MLYPISSAAPLKYSVFTYLKYFCILNTCSLMCSIFATSSLPCWHCLSSPLPFSFYSLCKHFQKMQTPFNWSNATGFVFVHQFCRGLSCRPSVIVLSDEQRDFGLIGSDRTLGSVILLYDGCPSFTPVLLTRVQEVGAHCAEPCAYLW